MTKVYIATKLIEEYEHDIATGVSSQIVCEHARKQVNRWRKMGTWAATSAADQLEEWISSR